ncbi:hypothetical protein DAPPUDRAFT_256944 [Daphnia pulex]|uniref:Uncharacterized protein n=1 Tax=Daphnia pulex TaxID=6669 RepID=E9HCJ4_DAPPU|nr:hypothetical protein DAPPUDRAFT_256944 [Daphnia pulex]|eukprot:EFX70482.1 hypothetical protein DAPPUDRAFT_256944 [Daphnia pulex]
MSASEILLPEELKSPIRIPDDKEEVTLTTSGLGSKVIQVPLHHSSKVTKKLIKK